LEPKVVNLKILFCKDTYSMVCLVLEPAVADLTPKDVKKTFSNCSFINTYSMACLGLEPEVVNLKKYFFYGCFILKPAVADLTPKDRDIIDDFF
jgi:hypothetical protein